MRVYHIRRAVAMLLLATMLLTVFPFTAFAETKPVQSGTEATTAIADPPEAPVEAETGQKAESPADSVPTDVFAEPSPTEEAVAFVSATETAETTEQPDPAAVDPEASEDQEPVETGSDSSLADKVADVITSIFDSLRGESANLTIPYRIYGAGANFGQVLKFWFQYPQNDTGHNVSLEGINGHYINNTVAYCLEPHRGATAGTAFSKLSDNSSTNMWTQKLSQNQRNAIALALAYGAPKGLYSNDTNTERGYEVATQIIVWEIIVGDRGAMKPFSRSNDRIYKFMDPIVKANQNNLHTINYNAFVNGYASITNKLTQYGRVPSFASSASSSAPTHTMTYNASNNTYSITLTDNNNVLGNYNFTNGNGFTFSKSGNKLTITATVAAMQNAPVLITAAGSDYDVSNMAMLIWGATGNQVMCQMANAPAKMSAYFKLNRQPDASVSLKKTANASQSVLDCIKGNDLYTLQGAVYEIHQGSPSGAVVDTLTTDKDGNAKSSKKYQVGTVLYAVEKTAPSGYLIDSNPVKLTVSATENNNVFKVSDKPTFDPNSLRLKKTGSAGERIQGAVFKVEFYAKNWADDNKLQRTWYFQSDADGYVYFKESYFAPGYSSAQLYKPDGIVQFPLGCVVVTEIKPAPGYKLPAGNDGKVVMFIRQGGTKVAKMGAAAGAYWGNGSADPLNTSRPKGIYKIENDSTKTQLTGVNSLDEGSVTLKKTATDGDVKDYCFKLYKWRDDVSWFGKSDANGNIYLTDENYTQSGTKVYTIEGLIDGEYTLLEVLSQRGKDVVWPESIRITVENGGTTVYDKTFENMTEDANGDCRLHKVKIEGLNGGGKMTITINNKPTTNDVEIIKTSPDGKIDGISFKVEQQVDGKWMTLGTYKTDKNGKITQNLPIGTVLRITEEVPAGYICLSDNPQTITTTAKSNRVSFENQPIAPVEIVKTSPDGKIEGISFEVQEQDARTGTWNLLGTYKTDKTGKIDLGAMYVGTRLRVKEIVPEGYVCLSMNPQTVTIQKSGNSVKFENRPIYGDLELIKVDEEYPDRKLSGAEFTVTLKNGSETTTEIMSEVVDEEGKGTGVYRLEHIEYGTICEIRETKAPEGYILSDKVFTATIKEEKTYQIGDGEFDCVTNRRIYGDLELIKVDEDYPDHRLSGAEFTVTMTNGNDTTTAVMTEVVDEEGKGTGVYRLEHIEYGTVCDVRETKAPDGYVLSDKVYTVTIKEEKVYTVGDGDYDCVTNRKINGSITVHKMDAENRPLRGVKMLLEYSTDNGVSWAPVQYRDEEDKIQNGYCTSEGLVDGILATGADGYVRYTGLAISTEDTKILYRLTEVETLPGLTLLAEPIYYGELTQSAPELAFTATNTASFQMPMTGGFGFAFAGIGFGLTILVALLSLLMLPKRKEQL